MVVCGLGAPEGSDNAAGSPRLQPVAVGRSLAAPGAVVPVNESVMQFPGHEALPAYHGIGAGVKLVALVGDEVRGAKYIVVLLKDAATQFAFRFFREAKMPCQTLYPSGNECPGTPRKKNPAEWRG